MKIFCEDINSIPSLDELITLTQKEHLVLEFPREEILSKTEKIISDLKHNLPENYDVFKSGVWEKIVTITILSLITNDCILENLEQIKTAITDYITVNNVLFENKEIDRNIIKNWQLIDEHGEHNRYENLKTKQILEASVYPINNIQNIDPYFLCEFIKTSESYPELKAIIKHDFHDSCRILEFIQD